MPPIGCLPSGSEQPELTCLLRGDDQLRIGSRGVDLGGCPLLLTTLEAVHASRDLLGPKLPCIKTGTPLGCTRAGQCLATTLLATAAR
jgi:hypothetical protein